ncbi:hypothetical protein [Roseomonas sp. BN140053]|uniref:hypothetical protein n=1 Tax=Roseomonas sp. BN140053 TaxID=3391898 RepID=UPI0039EBF4E6
MQRGASIALVLALALGGAGLSATGAAAAPVPGAVLGLSTATAEEGNGLLQDVRWVTRCRRVVVQRRGPDRVREVCRRVWVEGRGRY